MTIVTDKMLEAGREALREHTDVYMDGSEVVGNGSVEAVYRAMIAASPISLQNMQTTQGDGSSAKTPIPALADGQVADLTVRPWSKNNTDLLRSIAADKNILEWMSNPTMPEFLTSAANELDRLSIYPADQSSDVSGLVEALEKIVRATTKDVSRQGLNGVLMQLVEIQTTAREALAQAKRDGGAG